MRVVSVAARAAPVTTFVPATTPPPTGMNIDPMFATA
jgi:hypothetical protein